MFNLVTQVSSSSPQSDNSQNTCQPMDAITRLIASVAIAIIIWITGCIIYQIAISTTEPWTLKINHKFSSPSNLTPTEKNTIKKIQQCVEGDVKVGSRSGFINHSLDGRSESYLKIIQYFTGKDGKYQNLSMTYSVSDGSRFKWLLT